MDFREVAYQHIAIIAVPVMETIALAVVIGWAGGALSLSGPHPVAERLKTVLPHFIKIIGIDITLYKRPVDVGAGRNGAIDEHRTNINPGPAEETGIPHMRLVATNIPFATEFEIDAIERTLLFYKFHQFDKLTVGELQFGMMNRSANGNNGKEAPGFYLFNNQQFH